MQKMRDDKSLAIMDSAGETTVSIDMMCMKDFFSIDMFVRKLLVEQGDDYDEFSEGEEGERSVDEDDW